MIFGILSYYATSHGANQFSTIMKSTVPSRALVVRIENMREQAARLIIVNSARGSSFRSVAPQTKSSTHGRLQCY